MHLARSFPTIPLAAHHPASSLHCIHPAELLRTLPGPARRTPPAMLDFSPGVPLSREAYERRRDSTTRVELAKLLVSPEFKSWQEERTRPAPVHWEVVGGAALLALALVCTCVVVVVGPPASSPSGTASAALPVPSLAALPPPVSAGLEQAMGFSNQSVCSSNLLHALEVRRSSGEGSAVHLAGVPTHNAAVILPYLQTEPSPVCPADPGGAAAGAGRTAAGAAAAPAAAAPADQRPAEDAAGAG